MKNKVENFLEISGTRTTPLIRLADISSEFGELSKEILKATAYGKKDCVPNTELQMEYGDLIFSVIALGVELGVDADKALEMALKKYNDRLEQKGHIGSSK